MAKLIFTKNSAGVENCLYKIASSDSVLNDNKNFDLDLYDIVDCSTDDFNKVKQNIKYVVSHDGTNVTYTDKDPNIQAFSSEEDLKIYINYLIEEIKKYLDTNSTKPLANTARVYRDYLSAFNTSSITFPMTKTWEQHVSDQGQNYTNILELL